MKAEGVRLPVSGLWGLAGACARCTWSVAPVPEAVPAARGRTFHLQLRGAAQWV